MTPSKPKIDRTAVILLVVIAMGIGLYVYGRVFREDTPGDYHVRKANYSLEDGQFLRAEEEFKEALDKNPDHKMAHFGLALTYMQMEKNERALDEFGWIIEHDPKLAFAYANRGILLDRMGQYREALADYKKALELDPETAKGPGWVWRFLRGGAEKPPTISDRAAYIEEQLKLPPEERILKMPEVDEEQQMYKKKG